MKLLLLYSLSLALAQNVPLFGECENDEDCESGSCVTGFQAPGTPGTCVCNEETNAGCSDGISICKYPPGLDDGFPMCLADIGQECQYDFDCAFERCFYGEQQDNSPGRCTCHSETNAGCEEPYFCSDLDTARDGFPKCVLPVGSSCDENGDCETRLCFSNFLVEGVCACELETNLGCIPPEVCQSDPQLSDAPPSCQVGCTTNDECEDTGVCFDSQCQCNIVDNRGCNDGQVCMGDDVGGYRCAEVEDPDPAPTPGDEGTTRPTPLVTPAPTVAMTDPPTTTAMPVPTTSETPAPTTGSNTIGSSTPTPSPATETSNAPTTGSGTKSPPPTPVDGSTTLPPSTASPTEFSGTVGCITKRRFFVSVILPILLGLFVSFLSP